MEEKEGKVNRGIQKGDRESKWAVKRLEGKGEREG